MGNTDSIPVVSQGKSAFQAICGDTKGARQTQFNFFKGCPIVSQIGAVGAAVAGNTEYAKESQWYFVRNLSLMADSVPVVGHVKGGIHYMYGNKEEGDNAMKASSRTVGVIGGGIGGFIVGGPVGSVIGGITGGATMDGVITEVESAVVGRYVPSGYFAYTKAAINGELDSGGYFDFMITPFFDGLAGRAYAKAYQSIRANFITSRKLEAAIKEAVENNEITVSQGESISSISGQVKTAAKEIQKDAKSVKIKKPAVGSVVFDDQGKSHVGYSFKLREALGVDGFGGEVPSAQQILNDRLPGRAPQLRGAYLGGASCGEIHALHKHHQANGMNAAPSKTISVIVDPKTNVVSAVKRCWNCAQVGKYVNMGQVITDAINGTLILAEDAVLNKASLDILAIKAYASEKRTIVSMTEKPYDKIIHLSENSYLVLNV